MTNPAERPDRSIDITITDRVAKLAGLEPNMSVDISVSGNAIIIRPAGAPPLPKLNDLLAQATEQNRHTTIAPQKDQAPC